MAKNKVQEGDVIDFTAPFGNVLAGMLLTNDRMIGVALHDQPTAGQPVQCAMTGVWEVAKASAAVAYTKGVLVYANASGQASETAAAGAHKLAGAAIAAAGVGVTTVLVRLNGAALNV